MKKFTLLLVVLLFVGCASDDGYYAPAPIDYIIGHKWYLVAKDSQIDGDLYFDCNTDDWLLFDTDGYYTEDYGKEYCNDYEYDQVYLEGEWVYNAYSNVIDVYTRQEDFRYYIEDAGTNFLKLGFNVTLSDGRKDYVTITLER